MGTHKIGRENKNISGRQACASEANEALVHRSTAMNARVFETIKARSPVMYAHFLILLLNNHQN